jgi:hypothetical protein
MDKIIEIEEQNLCWPHWKNFGWQHRMLFFRLHTLCSARVSALMIVFSDSPCERMGKLDTFPILKEDGFLVRV